MSEDLIYEARDDMERRARGAAKVYKRTNSLKASIQKDIWKQAAEVLNELIAEHEDGRD